jgi:hypothetical protein
MTDAARTVVVEHWKTARNRAQNEERASGRLPLCPARARRERPLSGAMSARWIGSPSRKTRDEHKKAACRQAKGFVWADFVGGRESFSPIRACRSLGAFCLAKPFSTSKKSVPHGNRVFVPPEP